MLTPLLLHGFLRIYNGADGGIRTHTVFGLNEAPPSEVGLRRRTGPGDRTLRDRFVRPLRSPARSSCVVGAGGIEPPRCPVPETGALPLGYTPKCLDGHGCRGRCRSCGAEGMGLGREPSLPARRGARECSRAVERRRLELRSLPCEGSVLPVEQSSREAVRQAGVAPAPARVSDEGGELPGSCPLLPENLGVARGIRTPVPGSRIQGPGRLDDGDIIRRDGCGRRESNPHRRSGTPRSSPSDQPRRHRADDGS